MFGKKTIFFILTLIICAIGAYYVYTYYQKIYSSNVLIGSEEASRIIKIPSGSDFSDVTALLYNENIIADSSSFVWTAKMMEYPQNIRGGRYRVEQGMNNRALVQMLRAGLQEPLQIQVPSMGTMYDIAGFFGAKLEADSSNIIELLKNDDFLSKWDLNAQTSKSLFIPDTYEFYWNTSANGLLTRMHKEFSDFWTQERTELAAQKGLSPVEAITLASIVEAETYRSAEMPAIAGVYLNRLNSNMRLQADPTIIFILDDPSVKRVRSRDLQINSPYNTYQHTGLPPGPIGVPGKRAINAVLEPDEHDYLYFCAKADFSGYHDFSRTYREHLQCARRYRQALNQMGVHR